MEVCPGFKLVAIENAAALGDNLLELSKRPEAQMICYMRHGSPPRLMAPQPIDGRALREPHPAPSAGDRITARASKPLPSFAGRYKRRTIIQGCKHGHASSEKAVRSSLPVQNPLELFSEQVVVRCAKGIRFGRDGRLKEQQFGAAVRLRSALCQKQTLPDRSHFAEAGLHHEA